MPAVSIRTDSNTRSSLKLGPNALEERLRRRYPEKLADVSDHLAGGLRKGVDLQIVRCVEIDLLMVRPGIADRSVAPRHLSPV